MSVRNVEHLPPFPSLRVHGALAAVRMPPGSLGLASSGPSEPPSCFNKTSNGPLYELRSVDCKVARTRNDFQISDLVVQCVSVFVVNHHADRHRAVAFFPSQHGAEFPFRWASDFDPGPPVASTLVACTNHYLSNRISLRLSVAA